MAASESKSKSIGVQDELDIVSFFCDRCDILLRTVEEILEHKKTLGHQSIYGSTNNEQELYCKDCLIPFSLRTEADKHKNETTGLHSTFHLPNHEEYETKSSASIMMHDCEDGDDDDEALPFEDYDDEDDDEDTDEEDDEDDDDMADDPDYNPDEDETKKNPDFKFISFSDLLKLPHPSDDESLYQDDDDQSFEGSLATLRTLKNLGYKAKDRIEMRKEFVLAEGAGPYVVDKKIQKALDLYDQYGCFALKKRNQDDAFAFNGRLGQLCLLKKGATKCVGLKAKRIKAILQEIQKLLKDPMKIGIRENSLHYYLKKDVQEENLSEKGLKKRFSVAVLEISAMLRVSRESLKIRGSPKGMIQGDIKLYTASGLLCDCRYGGQTGTIIPSETDLITKIEIGQNVIYLLIFEKETAFCELTGEDFPEVENCILVCGKGHSDMATRLLLRKIRIMSPTLPMYCMVDYNPHGLLILATYCLGSKERCYDGLMLSVSDIVHIGLDANQIKDDAWLPLNKTDNILVKNMLKLDYFQHTEAGRSIMFCIEDMYANKKKSDIDFILRREGGLSKFIKDVISEEERRKSETTLEALA